MIAARWAEWTAGANGLAANTAFHDLKKMGSLGPKGIQGCCWVSLLGNWGSTSSIEKDVVEIAEHPAMQKPTSDHPNSY